MEEEKRSLNYECNYNIYIINNWSKTFPQNQRSLILMWIKKLQNLNSNIDEMYLRNDFMYFLLTCVKNNNLVVPFNEPPPSGNLTRFKHLLPVTNASKRPDADQNWMNNSLEESESKRPELYERSPDGGSFLSAQPVPRCGAYCYLALVSKPTKCNNK